MFGTNATMLTVCLLALWSFHCVRHSGKLLCLLSSLGTGALLGNTLFHLVPEAFTECTSVQETSTMVFVGYGFMLLLHRLLPCSQHEHREKRNIGYLNLVSRCLDNATDGTVIAAGFLCNVTTGITTILAVSMHEAALEVGSFNIMRASGFSRKGALLANLFSAGCGAAAAALVFSLGATDHHSAGLLRPLTTGLTLYTCCSVLIPREQVEKDGRVFRSRLSLAFAGVLVVSLFAHEHHDHDHDHSEAGASGAIALSQNSDNDR